MANIMVKISRSDVEEHYKGFARLILRNHKDQETTYDLYIEYKFCQV